MKAALLLATLPIVGIAFAVTHSPRQPAKPIAQHVQHIQQPIVAAQQAQVPPLGPRAIWPKPLMQPNIGVMSILAMQHDCASFQEAIDLLDQWLIAHFLPRITQAEVDNLAQIVANDRQCHMSWFMPVAQGKAVIAYSTSGVELPRRVAP